jgi:hypothetical protein
MKIMGLRHNSHGASFWKDKADVLLRKERLHKDTTFMECFIRGGECAIEIPVQR